MLAVKLVADFEANPNQNKTTIETGNVTQIHITTAIYYNVLGNVFYLISLPVDLVFK